jgi:hypothetical protein
MNAGGMYSVDGGERRWTLVGGMGVCDGGLLTRRSPIGVLIRELSIKITSVNGRVRLPGSWGVGNGQAGRREVGFRASRRASTVLVSVCPESVARTSMIR